MADTDWHIIIHSCNGLLKSTETPKIYGALMKGNFDVIVSDE